MRIVLGLVIALAGVPAFAGDWQEEKAVFDDYKAKLADAENLQGNAAKAAAHQALAEHAHCQRLGYVRAWRLETAAWYYLRAGRLDEATAVATAAIGVEDAKRDCKAKAHSILAQILGRKPDTIEAAKQHYEKALELDPSYEVARDGLADVRKAMESKGGSD